MEDNITGIVGWFLAWNIAFATQDDHLLKIHRDFVDYTHKDVLELLDVAVIDNRNIQIAHHEKLRLGYMAFNLHVVVVAVILLESD